MFDQCIDLKHIEIIHKKLDLKQIKDIIQKNQSITFSSKIKQSIVTYIVQHGIVQ